MFRHVWESWELTLEAFYRAILDSILLSLVHYKGPKLHILKSILECQSHNTQILGSIFWWWWLGGGLAFCAYNRWPSETPFDHYNVQKFLIDCYAVGLLHGFCKFHLGYSRMKEWWEFLWKQNLNNNCLYALYLLNKIRLGATVHNKLKYIGSLLIMLL
jgi:hypothetical protein